VEHLNQGWEYRVIGININNIETADASKASRKLGENLSAEFLEREFPKEYVEKKQTNMALQCQTIIQLYGKFGWEHYQQGQLGNTAMLYFKRPNEPRYKLKAKLDALEETMIEKLDKKQRP
jgi:hypothetical protein